MHFVKRAISGVTKFSALLCVGGFVYVQPYRGMVVVGRSMEPTYHNRSFELTRPFEACDVQVGNVVVIETQSGPIIKRIAYVPGDKITQAKVQGKWVDMIYIKPPSKVTTSTVKTRQIEVPKGMVYVLGDNLLVSNDSREFGFVPISKISRKLLDQRPNDLGIVV